MCWARFLGKSQQASAYNQSGYNNSTHEDRGSYTNLASIPSAFMPTIQQK